MEATREYLSFIESLQQTKVAVNQLEDVIDEYLVENEISDSLLEEIVLLRKSLPSHSSFQSIIGLLEEGEGPL